MSKKLARLLKADIQETSDLKSIAKMLAGKGRGGDTILAHITPKEVSLLKEAGGAGTVNPETGLLEFYDGFEIPESYSYGADYAASQYQPETYTAQMPEQTPMFDVTQYQAPGGYQAPTAAETPAYSAPAYTGGMFDYTIPETTAAAAPAAPAVVSPVGYPQGMMDIPVDTGAAPRAAIPMPGQRPSALAETPPAEKGISDYLKQLKDVTGLGAADLLRVGGAGAGAIVGRQQAQQAAKQIQQATQEQKNLGAPYQKTGTELQRAAMAGELTPQSAQALQAARAQLAQGVESRGGVGVAQAQAQIEALRQNLLQNQYNLGLQVSQIGDNIALGAIRTGMQLDQQLAQANQQFYTQLAQIAGGGTYGYSAQTPRG